MKSFDWLVIGAGPAGIAALGQLLDKGIAADRIGWLDPKFSVGDLGEKWQSVSSNTTVALFLKFLHFCPSFDFSLCTHSYHLQTLPPEQTCELKWVVEPLQWVSEQLCKKVQPIQGMAHRLWLAHRHWHVQLDNEVIRSKNVVMAIGALPNRLAYPTPTEIALEDALNRQSLATMCTQDDTIAVFGSSHSAIIIIRYLLERGVKCVINFYKESLRYAVNMDSYILFDNTGLKGETAKWAREHLDGDCPKNLIRLWSNAANIEQHLADCSKVVYAVGFNRRQLPVMGLDEFTYNDKCGIIAPGLFGCGIAFPEVTMDPLGNVETNVGLWKFMRYLDKIVPLWLKYNA